MLLATLPIDAAAAPDSIPAVPDRWESELGRDHPLAGVIWDVQEGREAEPEHVARRAAEARFVLLGEVHDNPDHHRLQAWVLDAMAAQGAKPAVIFEMIRLDRAEALRKHLEESPGDAAGLGDAVGWKEEGWPDWEMYEPVAEAALASGMPIRAGDVTREEQDQVSQAGLDALDSDRRSKLALDRPLPPDQAERMKEELQRAHCDLLPEHALPVVAQVQRLRDAVLAHSLVSSVEEDHRGQAVLIAGRGHVRADRGVPWYLRQHGEEAVLVVGLVQVEDEHTDPGAYLRAHDAASSAGGSPTFDYLWFTPRPHDRDFCAELKERMGGEG